MKKVLLIIVAIILISSCGVKDRPEYKSEMQYTKNIYKI